MKKPLHPRLREILRTFGPTAVATLATELGSEPHTVRQALRNMPDAYIHSWGSEALKGRRPALWSVVVPPGDEPYPEEELDLEREND